MDTRQAKLLAAIIDHFIESAVPVGSKELLAHANFCLSGATIRNEMRSLEEEGFLDQPHVSAGRMPTAQGYRLYVKEHMEPTVHEKAVRKKFDQLREMYFQRKDQELAYEAVTMLAQMIGDVAFATVPHKPNVYYMGLANVLRQPEFISNPRLATSVVEVLEQRLTDMLDTIDIDDRIRYMIGEEHVLPSLQSCSMMATSYKLGDHRGVVGILGPMRMDYAYNTVALDMVADLLRKQSARR